VTLVLDEYFGVIKKGKFSRERLRNHVQNRIVKPYLSNLNKRIYTNRRKRIPRSVFIEMNGRTHVHMIVETPEHISSRRMKALIAQSAVETPGVVGEKTMKVNNHHSLIDYLLKEINIDTDTVDIENSFFKKRTIRRIQ